jgi:hypothetical protein
MRILVFAQSGKLRMPEPIDLRFILHLFVDVRALRTAGRGFPL